MISNISFMLIKFYKKEISKTVTTVDSYWAFLMYRNFLRILYLFSSFNPHNYSMKEILWLSTFYWGKERINKLCRVTQLVRAMNRNWPLVVCECGYTLSPTHKGKYYPFISFQEGRKQPVYINYELINTHEYINFVQKTQLSP